MCFHQLNKYVYNTSKILSSNAGFDQVTHFSEYSGPMISCDVVEQDVVTADVISVTGAYCVSLHLYYACQSSGGNPHRTT